MIILQTAIGLFVLIGFIVAVLGVGHLLKSRAVEIVGLAVITLYTAYAVGRWVVTFL